MPQVLSDPHNNLYVYIYFNDHIPAHVHIFVGRKKSRSSQNIKISIGDDKTAPEILLAHPSIEKTTIKKAWLLVAKHQEILQERWQKIHTNKTFLRKVSKKQPR
ncbi:MAG TPA: DUF4160 domain-containing protein [Coleofasciculaceae cyanobacterium]|jgi:hypothetical protein